MLVGFCLNSSALGGTPLLLFFKYIFITSNRRRGSLLPSISLCLSMCIGPCAFIQLPYVLIVVFSPLNLCQLSCSYHVDLFVVISDAVDADESVALESKVAKETIDFKEVKRIDHILASLQRKVNSVYLQKFSSMLFH